MDEVFKKLESVDTQEASDAVGRLQKRLGNAREAQILGEIIDYFIISGSKQALKVLSSLKDVQSQVRVVSGVACEVFPLYEGSSVSVHDCVT